MNAVRLSVAAAAILGGCTHASISSTPMEVEGVGTVYRYQGRANFSHQIAEADRLMAEDCKTKNGGKPVIVNLQQRDLGTMTFNTGQSTTRATGTVTGDRYGATYSGTGTTTSTGTGVGMRSYNQEIFYKCVTQ